MSYSYNFNNDLRLAKKIEKKAAYLLIKKFKQIEENKKTYKTNDDNRYDFSFNINGKEVTYEVKDDRKTFEFPNIGIEHECRGKPSGISVTKADWWTHTIQGDFYITKVSTIKKLIEDKMYHRVTSEAGDAGSFTKIYLIYQEVL